MRSNLTALFGTEIARKQYILEGEITEQHHNAIVFISVPPKLDKIFDVEIMSEHNALNKIRQAFDLLIKKSPLSASVINQLKKQGNVIIVYDPNFPTEDFDSTGVLLAAFIPDLVWPASGGSISNNFPLIISRYLAKWSPEWMASGIAHELVGHGLQHSRRKFQSNLARTSDIECEAWLYQEQAIQDLGMDKRGSEMVGHRQGFEKLCAGLKGYMATHTPSQTILWSALNPNVPKILSIFGEYVKLGR
jgi:hypothetical protein